MSRFNSQFGTLARSPLMTQFGVSATYHNADGTTTSCTVIALEDNTDDATTDGGREAQRHARFQLSAAEIADPHVSESITVDSEKWAIVDVESRNVGGMHTLKMMRAASVEHSNRGYRGQR